MKSKTIWIVAVGVFITLTRVTLADVPPIPAVPVVVIPDAPAGTFHTNTPSTLTTDGGTDLRLPKGYWMDEDTYAKQDANFKKLQDSVTNLTAQNNVYAKDAASWQPGWRAVLATFVSGVVLGGYLMWKL